MRTAYLLVNVGTPKSPSPQHVGEYLSEFLKDPEIIRLPWLFRKILVDGIIVPTRSPKSAHAYQSIWTEQGSPLMVLSEMLIAGLNQALPDQHKAFLAMRYQEPSIANVLKKIQQEGYEKLVVFPLYPQYARATSYSTEAKVKEELQKLEPTKFSQILWGTPFYDEKFFLEPIITAANQLPEGVDHVLFSYHGLPSTHIYGEKNCERSHQCCLRPKGEISHCYRAQCLQTTMLLQSALDLNLDNSSMSFQSRLGRTEWLGPYTQKVVIDLAQKGVRSLLVICPSFVTDCLETIEEIDKEARQLFLSAGGTHFHTLKAPNYNPVFIQGLKDHLLQMA